MDFPSPVGLSAGFDKNGEAATGALKLGFGFTEVGTVTPNAQSGNDRPRVFRLVEDQAVINRLGFNNHGHRKMLQRLTKRPTSGIIGVNIGANKDSADRISDYILGVETFHRHADYLTINISSPNTPGLRGLQVAGELEELLSRIQTAARKAGSTTPLLVKLAPDLELEDLEAAVAICLKHGIAGLIISNTTLARPALRSRFAPQAGGLSGAPLFEHSTAMLAKVYGLTQGKLPLIGVGGITSGETAWQKILAGASLVQIYTGLIYKGPGLIDEINRHLEMKLEAGGFQQLNEAVGTGAKEWAKRYHG